MADDSKVWVENQTIVQRIHQKLKREISEIVEAKSWSVEKAQAFEKILLELYKDVIQETVKSNVSVSGKEWVDEPIETQSETTAHTVQESVNKERLKEVNDMWSSLEDLIRETTGKRKKYPPIITNSMKTILQCKVELLETYSPAEKSETIQHSHVENKQGTCIEHSNNTTIQHSHVENKQDKAEYIQRLQDVIEEQARLSKIISPMFQPQTFPGLQDKVEGLHQVISTQQEMEASETDAVLFGKIKSVTPRPSTRRTSRLLRTPDRYTSTVEPLYNGHLGTNLCGRCVEVAIVKWF
ncbi:hypothetical protein QZH41_020613 [Actinostola sp. cb2023]|nr:hypothetical protein QZH41_020613 [Actinostola sp. cb2023]